MVKKKSFIMMLGLSVMLFCTGFVGTIFAMTSTSVTNYFETGAVDIKLTEYRKVGDKEELFEGVQFILPAAKISQIPRIQNDGSDCYVRAKITFRETTEINESNLFGISEKWLKADDGYYYYTDILHHGEDVDIFEGVKIQEDLSQDMEGKDFYIDIDVDAIQAKNFTPQYDLAAPWGNVEIVKFEKGDYDINTLKQSDTKTFKIEYQGESRKLIANSEDFFVNFPYLMPADKYSETATIVNDGKNSIKLYFRSEALETSELLDKILLKITTTINERQEIVYEGVLRASELSEDVLLGIIPANATGDFNFEIEVPEDLTNKYALESSHVKWTFSTAPIESVQTGDSSGLGFYAGMMVASFALFMFSLVWFQRKERKLNE